MNDVPRDLLRETLRGRLAAAPAAGCIDSERLAAWSDGTVHARERAAIEGHASGCARCQGLLAAMARISPPVAASRWWRSAAFGWVAPLAAAAAAVVLWINVPRSPVDRSVAPPEVVTAKPEPAASVAAPQPSASPSSALPEVSERRPVATRRQARAKTTGTATASDASRPAQPSEDPAAAAIPQTKGVAEDIGPPAKFEGAPPSKFDGAGGPAVVKTTVSPPEIVSPDASVRWRILPGGQAARSVDRGATWQEQSTGVSITLTAGAAPSPGVCWLVGAAGTIVLSTDGRTWQRVPFPEAIELVSVRASDAANATVTTADGRTFGTTDGGKRWRQP